MNYLNRFLCCIALCCTWYTGVYAQGLSVTAEVYSNYNGADVSCTGASDGAARVLVQGGNTPYRYQWGANAGGAATAIVRNLSAGTYSVTVTDNAGDALVESVTLQDPVPLAATATSQDPTCAGGSDGQITYTATSGTGTIGLNGYEYRIAGPGQQGNVFSSQNTFTGLQAGDYILTVRDGNGCETQTLVRLADPTPIQAQVIPTIPSCVSSTDGQAVANATGGTSPYTYAWSTGAVGDTLRGVGAGLYTVTVTDALGCTLVESVQIDAPQALQVAVATSSVSCNGGSNGSATARVTGGAAPYSYAWSTGGTGSFVGNLSAGTYELTVTDQKGCTEIERITITESASLVASISTTALSCASSNDGTATIQVSGGANPYTYLWTDGQTTATATGLEATSYNVTVRDANGCSVTLSATINAPAPLQTTVTSIAPSCATSTDGTATAIGQGGTTPYTYTWSTGAVTAQVSNLTTGSYAVTLTDANGCISSESVTIQAPDTLRIDSIRATRPTCAGMADATAQVYPSGGTKQVLYTYQWSTGATSQQAGSLAAGTYTVTVIDDNGCSVDAAVQVAPPAQALALTLQKDDASCAGQSNGAATAIPGGGQTPLAYTWSTGATTKQIAGLATGTYIVTVSDANNCQKVDSIKIEAPAALQINFSNINAPSCDDGQNGTATAQVAGGTTPYTFLWGVGTTNAAATTLSEGMQTVQVTDAEGCISMDSLTIPEAQNFEVTATVDSISCVGSTDGQIQVQTSVPVAAYQWSTGGTGAILSNLSAGTYTLTATTSTGCVGIWDFDLQAPIDLTTTLNQTEKVRCQGDATAAIELEAQGGAAPYIYQWSTGATTARVENLAASNYYVTMTDAKGCVHVDSLEVEEPTALQLTASITNTKCSQDFTGQIELTAQGGTTGNSPYAYRLGNAVNWQAGNLFIGLGSGTYQAYVKDSEGCIHSEDFTVEANATSLTFTQVSTDTTILLTGTTTLTAQTNKSDDVVQYTWRSSLSPEMANILTASTSTLEAQPQTSGRYWVTAVDTAGCEADTSIFVHVKVRRTARVANTFTPNADGSNDVIFVQGGSDVASVQSFRVFSRWGELIYHAENVPVNDPTYGWDGTVKGKYVSSGIYGWTAEVEFIDGKILQLAGDLTVLR